MTFLIVLAGFFLALSQNVHAVQVPASDQARIVTSVRKSLSVMPNWEIRLLDVNASSFTGLYQGTVEFKFNENVRYQNIFISGDFKKYIIGNVFDSTEDSDATRLGKMKLKGSPFKGPETAPVTIVEYSDLQCPSCKKAHEKLQSDKILESYPGKVKLVFKNKPFPMAHPWATDAAVACQCAFRQKSDFFWSMADQIYMNQSSITVTNLWDNLSVYAKNAGLNFSAFKKCYDGKETLDLVNADVSEAESLGVSQTPTFFINGRAVVGYQDPQVFHLLIQEFLSKK